MRWTLKGLLITVVACIPALIVDAAYAADPQPVRPERLASPTFPARAGNGDMPPITEMIAVMPMNWGEQQEFLGARRGQIKSHPPRRVRPLTAQRFVPEQAAQARGQK